MNPDFTDLEGAMERFNEADSESKRETKEKYSNTKN